MTIARVVRNITPNKISVELKTLSDTIRLTLDRDNCQGCDVCATVCLKDAVEIGPIGGGRKGQTSTPPITINNNKCVLCGTCVIMCPFGALEIEINNESRVILTEYQAIPPLDCEEMKNTQTGVTGQKYIEGEIHVDSIKCPGGCSTCVDICPFEAFSLPQREHPWDKVPQIEVNQEKCNFCGACVHACPAFGAITLNRKKINWIGAPTRFAKEVEESLLEPKSSRMFESE